MGSVAIGVAWCGPPTWMLMESLMNLEAPAPGYQFIRNPKAMAVDVARNYIVWEFLERRECEWLLFVDRDAQLHPQTLMRLLSWGEPVVAALAFTKGVPVTPVVYKGWTGKGTEYWIKVHDIHEWLLAHREELCTHRGALVDPRPDDGLYEVDFTGCHCLLVHREVLERMKVPWFRADERCRQEDRYFCEKARELGYRVWVDRSVVAGHGYGEERSCGGLDFLAWYAIADWQEEVVE